MGKTELIVETHNLRLFRLERPRRTWTFYLLEGSTPEAIAMLQSLYSRSPVSIETRLRDMAKKAQRHAETHTALGSLAESTREQLAELLGLPSAGELETLPPERQHALLGVLREGGKRLLDLDDQGMREEIERFMGTYYVGYNHKSIGDCGTVTLFLENVPIGLPTQIQDSALYRGQELSTRYNRMADDAWNPLGSALGQELIHGWGAFIRTTLPPLEAYFKDAFPFVATTDEPKQLKKERAAYERSIAAAVFDRLGAFLPLGAPTRASWTTDLRQAHDHLRFLCTHPDPLNRDAGEDLLDLLRDRYPSSFKHERWIERDAWFAASQRETIERINGAARTTVRVAIPDPERLGWILAQLRDRPPRADISRHLGNAAQVQMLGRLDMRSFRDIHRHRPLSQPVPRLDWNLGFHPWYLEELEPIGQRADAEALLGCQHERFERLGGDPFERQYLAPLGALIPYEARGDLGPVVYAFELRSKPDTHPTVRHLVHEGAGQLQAQLPGLALTIDRSPGRFNARRGAQTIFNRDTGEAV